MESARGNSSHNHNPFVMLRRPGTDEDQGEVIGLSLAPGASFQSKPKGLMPRVTRVVSQVSTSAWARKLPE